MVLSAKQLKAINWYRQENGLKPQLSTPPTMYFKDADGNEVTADLTSIMQEYGQWNEEDKKVRAREKRVKTASANARPGLYS